MGVLCTWVKLLRDLQILVWGSYSTPSHPLSVIRGRGRKGMELEKGGREGKEVKG